MKYKPISAFSVVSKCCVYLAMWKTDLNWHICLCCLIILSIAKFIQCGSESCFKSWKELRGNGQYSFYSMFLIWNLYIPSRVESLQSVLNDEDPTTAGYTIRCGASWATLHRRSDTLCLTYISGWLKRENNCGIIPVT